MTAATDPPAEWAVSYIERCGWSPVPLWTVSECAAGRCTQDSCAPRSHGKHPRVRWQEP